MAELERIRARRPPLTVPQVILRGPLVTSTQRCAIWGRHLRGAQAPWARAKDGYRSDAACAWPPRPRTRLFGAASAPGSREISDYPCGRALRPIWCLDLSTWQEDLKRPFSNTVEGNRPPFLITSRRHPWRNFGQQHE